MSDAGFESRVFHLLSLAKTVRHYEEALTQANGERFNLFNILQVDHYEVRTHSPLLAELLNPKGSHGQGAVFLQHFLTELKIHDFDAESAQVDTEVSIGDQGRLDIVITDGNGRSIFIENKIRAVLQAKQLERYHKHDPKAILLFLTLNGDPPADWATNTVYNSDSFKRIFQAASYKTDIVRWLESCRKEATAAPGVRETMTQYIHVLQRLTQQNTSTRMNNELIKAVLTDKETYLAYANLRDANLAVRRKIIEKLNAEVLAAVPEGLTSTQVLKGNGDKYEQYNFSTPGLLARHLSCGIGFESRDYRSCFYGFEDINHPEKIRPDKTIRNAFEAEFGASDDPTPYWPAWQWMPDRNRNWNDEVLANIQFEVFHKEIMSVVQRLKRVADQICKAAAGS
ncbi:MAG: PD-(D/E)XK nuclease family protein [Verrucomicrobiota bacterium]|jgi:hypothetical protein